MIIDFSSHFHQYFNYTFMGGGGILIGGGKHKYATFYKSLTKQFKLQLNDIYQNMIGQCKSNCHTIVGTETLVSILSK